MGRDVNRAVEVPDARHVNSTCYRLAPHYLVFGSLYTAFFLGMDVWAVYSAYFNIDGSFPHPKLHALVHGIFWSAWVLFGIWFIVTYFRERLYITNGSITQHGCVVIRQIRNVDAIQIVWRGTPDGGTIVVRSQMTKVVVHLCKYTREQRAQLVQLFHETFPAEIQDGWTQFSKVRAPDSPLRPSLQAGLVCALILLSFGAVCAYCWTIGFGFQWLIIAVLNALAGSWYFGRIYRYWRMKAPG